MMLIFVIYELLVILGIILYPSIYILRRKFSFRAFIEKLSFFPPELEIKKNSLWIQVVSIGEVILVREFLSQLKERMNLDIVISTTTLTGYEVANKLYSSIAKIIFFPFDSIFVLKRVIKKIKPKLFVSVETEIWLSLFYQLHRRGIPIVIINGRISDRAYSKYKKVKFIIKKLLSLVSFVCVQNKQYEDRFIYLGADKRKVSITGNMKFEAVTIKKDELVRFQEKYKKVFELKAKFILAASTHHPEEKIILDIYKDLLSLGNIKLLIAPRHKERVNKIEELVKSYGFNPLLLSEIRSKEISLVDVFILDTVGELFYFYSIGEVCFVGGSLVNIGGHNILEPIYWSKPTLFGPFMDNFREIEEKVLAYKAAIKVKDADDLKTKITDLLRNVKIKEELAVNCSKVFAEEKKYLRKNVEIVLKCLN
ncbi:MAG: 3-deoxy-D-manno-octulosonic acid transferase [Candidatus Omnitrophica bacterium]|nr:3-deoxy-D-manno-octulosonic acid transferase [Candidatus Omnitrophota bacterium]